MTVSESMLVAAAVPQKDAGDAVVIVHASTAEAAHAHQILEAHAPRATETSTNAAALAA